MVYDLAKVYRASDGRDNFRLERKTHKKHELWHPSSPNCNPFNYFVFGVTIFQKVYIQFANDIIG